MQTARQRESVSAARSDRLLPVICGHAQQAQIGSYLLQAIDRAFISGIEAGLVNDSNVQFHVPAISPDSRIVNSIVERDVLHSWITDIKNGKFPDFGNTAL